MKYATGQQGQHVDGRGEEEEEEAAATDSLRGRRKERWVGYFVWCDSSILPLGSDVISVDGEKLKSP